MSTFNKNISDRLIVFTRYPVSGITKTRLIKDIGANGAANVHRKLTENIISQIKQLQAEMGLYCEVCYTGGSMEEMEEWLGNDLTYTEQEQGDLGGRMYKAITGAINAGSRKVVLIGTDIPEPVSGYIEKAFFMLDEKDIILGPTIDGGYWLVGMKSPHNIFNEINWGTEAVLPQTVNLIKQQGLTLFLLPEINDIDTVDDLIRCKEHEIIKQHLSRWLSFRNNTKD